MIRDAKGHGSADRDPRKAKLAAELREAMQSAQWRSMDRANRAFRRLMRRRSR